MDSGGGDWPWTQWLTLCQKHGISETLALWRPGEALKQLEKKLEGK